MTKSRLIRWLEADPSDLLSRMLRLESELRLAATLLESREAGQEAEGLCRSPTVTQLQEEWKALLAEEPTPKREEAA